MSAGKFKELLPRLGLVALACCLLVLSCSVRGSPTPPSSGSYLESPAAVTLIVNTEVPTQPDSTGTPGTPGAATDPQDPIAAAFQKLQGSGPYRVHSVTSTSGSGPFTLDVEIIFPSRYHLVTPSTEIIIVGDQTYLKDDNVWEKSQLGPGSMLLVPDLIAIFTNQNLLGISSVHLEGSEVLNGIPAQVYSYQTSSDLGGGTQGSQARIWISDLTGLPVHQEITGQTGGVASQTVQDIQLDPSIQINPPIP